MTGDATTTPIHRLGAYELRSRIGEGGMGVVYRAFAADGSPVAVKVLRPHVAGDREGRDRFAREVRAMRRVRGPRVAEVVDANVTAETPYVVTRYIDGPPLYEAVGDGGPLSERALVRLGSGLAEALQVIHAAGVVHRDLKPGNVLMVHGEPVVIDFGIAQVADETRVTSTGMLVGTPGYLAPEVIEGKPATWASDVHSWAATLAFAATGRPPFGRGAFEAVVFRVISGRADLTGVPPRLLPVLRMAMARDPLARPRPTELAGLLVEPGRARVRAAGQPRPVVPPAVGAVVPTPRPTRPLTVVPSSGRQPVEPPPQQQPVRQPVAEKRGAQAWSPRLARPRPLLSVLLLALAAATGASAPFMALVLLTVAFVLARTVDRQGTFLRLRRDRRGRTASDVVVMVSALPWHAARSALFTVLTVPIAAIGGLAFVTLAALLTPSALQATNTHMLGALFAASTAVFAWWGVEGEGLRSGTRRVLGVVSQPRPVFVVAALVLAVVACGLAVEALSGPVQWWPFDGDPRSFVGGMVTWLREHRFFG